MRRILSFKYAFNGIFLTFKKGANFRIQSSLGVLTIILGFVLHISPLEWAIIVLLVGIVLSAEIFNTTLEEIIGDLPDDKVRGETKDMAAGFVLILAIASLIIGLIIFLPKILK